MSRLSQEAQTPELAEVIGMAIHQALADVNVCLPARIVAYDPATQMADVQPVLQKRYETGVLVKIPVIPNVPVVHPRTRNAFLHLPVAPGDDCVLVFAQRSLDNWKIQGGFTDPADRRRFNLSDAICLMGGSAKPDAFTVADPQAVEVSISGNVIQIKSDGTVNLGSATPDFSAALGENVEARLSAIESGLTALVNYITAHVHTSAAPGSPTTPPTVPPTGFTPDTSDVSSSKVKVKE